MTEQEKMIKNKHFINGFRYIEIGNASASANIALQGAHVFHYERVGEKPLLWLSKKSFFEIGKAIRGGVPVCWPWFGKHPTNSELPQHGFARSSVWELLQVKEIDEHTTEVILQLQPSAESLQLWPHKFELLLAITVGRTLTLALTTRNCDAQPFEITSALHSYFAVENIEKVHVEGLADKSYFDKVTGEKRTQQGNLTVCQEVDRVYRKVDYPVTLYDQTRTVHLDAQGSSSVVVWNPWLEKCVAIADMKDDAYKTMLCIEAANASGDARMLAPGEEHTLTSVISSDQEILKPA
ncbi:MAG: D-hexose-6-phosphate mutarotase [Thermodesulfobacteriota bacterium]|nr:D-hexose-6-phosphate mutarotase [Thermodesulfobacteriota bacterium]